MYGAIPSSSGKAPSGLGAEAVLLVPSLPKSFPVFGLTGGFAGKRGLPTLGLSTERREEADWVMQFC